MRAKIKTQYVCGQCGAQSPQWAGQCGECGAWNSYSETVAAPSKRAAAAHTGFAGQAGSQEAERLADIDARPAARRSSGMGELDRVLGGGLVAGSVVLIGGDPGIGKSTVLLQSLAHLSTQASCLYVTGEESKQQVGLRAARLGLRSDQLQLLSETHTEAMLAAATRMRPAVMAVDSIQTAYTDELQSAPGTVGQVRECAARLVRFAKQSDTVLFLIGHVTKEGALAGPRVLEHMVDTVLYFEGEQGGRHRVLRAIKNRFGAVNELGVFAMTDKGLREVSNPSAIFLSRHEQPVPGSVILVTREGSRPLLVEVQALVDQNHGQNPRRVALGLEANRLAMLLAVMHRHGGIAMADQDVFVNVVGGVRVSETAADLAVLLAALSSLRGRPLPADLVVFGELGLAGEIRPVSNGVERLREAEKHGFKYALVPKANCPKSERVGMLKVLGAARLDQALALVDDLS